MVGHNSYNLNDCLYRQVLFLVLLIITLIQVPAQSVKTLSYKVGEKSASAKIRFNTFLLNTGDKKKLTSTKILLEELKGYDYVLIQPEVLEIEDEHDLKQITSTSNSKILNLVQDPTLNEILYKIDQDKLPGTEILSLKIKIEALSDPDPIFIDKTVNLTYEFKISSEIPEEEEATPSNDSSEPSSSQKTTIADNPAKEESKKTSSSKKDTIKSDLQEDDEKVWKYVTTSDDYFDYYHYVIDYPDGIYVDTAKSILMRLSQDKEASIKVVASLDEPDSWSYILEIDTNRFDNQYYSLLPPLKISYSYNSDQLTHDSLSPTRFQFEVTEPVPFEITLKDQLGREHEFLLEKHIAEDSIQVTDGSSQPDILDVYPLNDTLFFKIKGGTPPFSLWMERSDSSLLANDTLPAITLKSKNEYLYYTDSKIAAEIYSRSKSLKVSDTNDRYSSSFSPKETNSSEIPLKTWILVGVALGVIFITIIVLASQKRRKSKEEDKEGEEKETDIHISSVKTAAEGTTKKIKSVRSRTRLVSELATEVYGPISAEVKGKGWIENSGLAINSDQYIYVDLEELWENTAIRDLYINKESVTDLDVFINERNNPEFVEDQQGVPEIGGFFLGNYTYNDDHTQYIVFLEKFIPVDSEDYDVYKLEFGIEAWRTLADVQDQYTEMETVAWFHTHPGHGLFLSQADLKIHQGFFKKRYQLAVEIDSLKEGLDIAFFTRTLTGDVNNNYDLRNNVTWHKWNEVKRSGNNGN